MTFWGLCYRLRQIEIFWHWCIIVTVGDIDFSCASMVCVFDIVRAFLGGSMMLSVSLLLLIPLPSVKQIASEYNIYHSLAWGLFPLLHCCPDESLKPHLLHEFSVCIWSQSSSSGLECLNEGFQPGPLSWNTMVPPAGIAWVLKHAPRFLLKAYHTPSSATSSASRLKQYCNSLGWEGMMEGKFLSKLWRWFIWEISSWGGPFWATCLTLHVMAQYSCNRELQI